VCPRGLLRVIHDRCIQYPFRSMSVVTRLCCKSRKLQGHDFFAKTRNRKQSPIRIDAVALSKSPVNLTLGDEVPHIFTRKPHLRPLEFLILGAKRLLQHNRRRSGHRADLTSRPGLTQSEIGGGLELFSVNFIGGSKRNEFV